MLTASEKRQAARERRNRRRRGEFVPPVAIRRGPSEVTARFLAIDGEGGNLNGRHEYTLLVAAGKRHASHVHNRGRPLKAKQCLDFILGLPKERKLISFYFNYDVTMMLRDLPDYVVEDLLYRDGRTSESGKTRPTIWREYALDWIPGKMFKVGKAGSPMRTVYDTAGFFQSSLVVALEGWQVGDEDEKAFIQRMKGQRSEFTGEVNPEVIEYAETECRLLCKLMDLVYRESASLGFHLRTFSGAGSLANAMLEKWGVHENVGILPENVAEAAWHGYFGGRFETAAVGEIPGPIYEYDINSAYPYAMQNLPCLAHGTWRHDAFGAEPDANNRLTIHRVRWSVPSDGRALSVWSAQWGPFPWRSDRGSISFPFSGEGWYWRPEVEVAMGGPFGAFIEEIERWTFIPKCDHKPFALVPELFARRKQLKAEGHLAERVIKLGINSLYGKTAQSVGSRKFASPVWAGWITSTCRAMCLSAIYSREGFGDTAAPNVIMVATDAVYSRVPLPTLCLGDNLGEWEAHKHDDMLIVQPGVYALNLDSTTELVRKTRGIRKTSFDVEAVRELWHSQGIEGSYEAPVVEFIGLRKGKILKQSSAGDWVTGTRALSFYPRSKRLPNGSFVENGATMLQCIPADTGEPTLSAKYSAKPLTDTLRQQWLETGDDFDTPTPDENPGIIPGFVRTDVVET